MRHERFMYAASIFRRSPARQPAILSIVPKRLGFVYFGASAAGAAGAGGGAAAGVPAGGAEAAACGCALGLIQQAWTSPLKLDGTLGSINPPNLVRQRKAAWTWPPGQPNRSYRSRWRNAVSRSSSHI